MSDVMRCPKCNRLMIKITDAPYLLNGSFFYTCNHCNYISDLMTENNTPFGDNYPALEDYDESLDEWRFKKKEEATKRLKKENVKIINKMYDEFGMMTDDDEINLAIWLYEFNKKGESDEDKR